MRPEDGDRLGIPPGDQRSQRTESPAPSFDRHGEFACRITLRHMMVMLASICFNSWECSFVMHVLLSTLSRPPSNI